MTKIRLVASIKEPMVREAERLERLYDEVVHGKCTTEELIDKLKETSRLIAEVQNKIEAAIK